MGTVTGRLALRVTIICVAGGSRGAPDALAKLEPNLLGSNRDASRLGAEQLNPIPNARAHTSK